MFRIKKELDGETTILQLIGRIQSPHLQELKEQIGRDEAHTELDLSEVTMVDVEAIRFLSSCEQEGITLRHCSAFIREWIVREREAGGRHHEA
jgi:anti-anti-sigma regulatory factor